MILINRNELGRIYVRKFEIEKIVYLFLKDYYPSLKCYDVSYHDNKLAIFVKKTNTKEQVQLEVFQEEAESFLKKAMGLYIKEININIK